MSEITPPEPFAGGANLKELAVGRALVIQTRNATYRLTRVEPHGAEWPFTLAGHPRICPEPVKARVFGSTWGGSMLKMNHVGRGMKMEFQVESGKVYTTTDVSEIEEVPA